MRIKIGWSVDLLNHAALANLAILVSGQCLDDKVARVPRGHGMALGMVIADRRRADVIVMVVAGVERYPDCRRAAPRRPSPRTPAARTPR